MAILLTKSGGLFGPIARVLGFLMNGIFSALSMIGIENIGLSIIFFTIVTYTILLPLTVKQQKNTKVMAVMNPEIQALQKKYEGKKDTESMTKMQEETKLIYDKYGTSPTGGCLGSFIQLPILFALWPVIQNIPAYVTKVKNAYMPLVKGIKATDGYRKIMEKIGTTGSIFIDPKKRSYTKSNTLIDVLYKFQDSNWKDLQSKFPNLKETIASTKEKVTSMNSFCGINLAETPTTMFKDAISRGWSAAMIGMIIAAVAIPILAGVTQWINTVVAQKASETPADKDKKKNENPTMQSMNIMMKIMPLVSVVMCFTMPTGLGLYWIASAVVRTVQQFFVNKHLEKKTVEAIVEENAAKAEKKRKKKGSVQAETLNRMATTSTKNLARIDAGEENKGDSRKNAGTGNDTYQREARPGSLASKANMVRDFNNRNQQGGSK